MNILPRCLALVTVAVSLQPGLSQSLIDEPPDPKEMLEIDGSREPHRIPEWSAWQSAFHSLSGGDTIEDLPTALYQVASPVDVDSIFTAVAASKKNDATYDEYRLALFDKLLGVRRECDRTGTTAQTRKACFVERGLVVSKGFPDYEIAYRQHTLDIRDRLLAELEPRPEVRGALTMWVESQKAGMKAFIHKSREAHYYKPR